MTNEPNRLGTLPFICRFAEPLPDFECRPLRYDPKRQIAQVFIQGRWLDSADAPSLDKRSSRFTRVERETSDDA